MGGAPVISGGTLFVSWRPHSRPRYLAERLDAQYLVPAPLVTSWWWPARYVIQAVATVAAIVRRRPATVLFTNPPFFAGLACLVGSRLIGAQCWADCHSGAYNDPRWARFAPANAAVVKHCRGAVFHNALLAKEQHHACVSSVVLSVYAMKDRVRAVASSSSIADSSPLAGAGEVEQARPLIVAICSHGFDEPVDAILAAAKLVPNVDLAMTGCAPPELQRRAPANVRLTGWLEERDYHEMISRARAVVCLTTREATMQNGIIEALEHRRPVITSNTRTLRAWSSGVPGVVTVAPESEALAAVMAAVVADGEAWVRRAEWGQRAALDRAEAELSLLKQELTAGVNGRANAPRSIR
jgi:glycosyltransferase involved in cell wall biosynthesis